MTKHNAKINQTDTLTIHIDISRNILILLSFIILVSSAVLIIFADYKNAEASLPLQAELTSNGLRKYYLTSANCSGADADGTDDNGAGVCASGYHFASLWEILDISNLEYNPLLGVTTQDSGKGPPSMTTGWVRTGFSSDSSGTAGRANCDDWDSLDGSGSTIWLPENWIDTNAQKINVWNTEGYSCSNAFHVWCVED